MARNQREALESPVEQGIDEKRPYTFDFTGLGTTAPANPVCQVWDITDGTGWQDVTSTALPTNTPSASGAIVTTSLLQALTSGRVYRLECRADGAGGSVYEGFVIIYATR